MPLTVIKELTLIRPPNVWNLSAEDFLSKVAPQTPGWGGMKCAAQEHQNLIHSICSLPGSILLIGGFLSITAY